MTFHNLQGLTLDEVLTRQRSEGANELNFSEERHFLVIAKDILKDPMFLLLLGAGLIYFVLGDKQEATALMGFVVIIVGVTIIQERRTEKALLALRDLASPRALVIREGNAQRIAGREVVVDDVVVLSEGDRIPADGQIIEAHDLFVDESMLTGESTPVSKFKEQIVYAGTLVVKGKALITVTHIGLHTELGRISHSLSEIKEEPSPIQKEVSQMTQRLALMAGVLCMLLTLSYWIIIGGWLKGLLAGITLAMAILPQEFPVILIIFLTLGARRIAKERVLTRRLNTIETLGETTVLCVDKTGTLTKNQMVLSGLCVGTELYHVQQHTTETLPETYHALLEYAVLASDVHSREPMELSFQQFMSQHLGETEHIHTDGLLLHEYSLTPDLLAMTRLWDLSVKGNHTVAAKGAPEAIIDLCHLNQQDAQSIMHAVSAMAELGWRVLGVAKAEQKIDQQIPHHQHDFDFTWLGLVGFEDPLREGVSQAITQCHRAGIRVVMITGDHPHTAATLAHQAGIHPTTTLTGKELEQLSTATFTERVRSINIFARVSPQQKLKIVDALKAQGEVVAMTGDGVNDAPALKSAHIGIAMGKRGTDVARESASLVLLEDDFNAIVSAIKQGREIFFNLRQALLYILSVHIPVIGLSVLPVFFKLPSILMPMHIAFLELLIGPLSSMVFEAHTEGEKIMIQPPRPATEKLLSKHHLFTSVISGMVITLIIFLLFVALLEYGITDREARTVTFFLLVLSNLAYLLATEKERCLHFSKSQLLWSVVLSTLAIVLLLICVPDLSQLFLFSRLSSLSQLVVGLMGLLLCVYYWQINKINVKWLNHTKQK
ncbi:MAG: cation-translocating P-type ATPase [Betaproteobacteria bacterium]|nr:cation-translocating P-type ATPase [Betaproteobacteria bacterium]MDE2424031.1 cation-translocating P-type ATPase [Betaproteobacteria bacterium]